MFFYIIIFSTLCGILALSVPQIKMVINQTGFAAAKLILKTIFIDLKNGQFMLIDILVIKRLVKYGWILDN